MMNDNDSLLNINASRLEQVPNQASAYLVTTGYLITTLTIHIHLPAKTENQGECPLDVDSW